VGEVNYADVMSDRYSGRSKGCGVVEFANKEDVQIAIDTMNGSVLDGREISCREDRPPPEGGFRREGRRDGPPRDRGDREPRGDRGVDRDRNTDNPELEKKMDDDLDNYFANKPADEEGAPPAANAGDGAEPARAEEAPPADAGEPAN
jgi:RNA recognition motif-containing protein